MGLSPARETHVCIALLGGGGGRGVPCPPPLPIPRGGTGDMCAGDSTAGTSCASSPAQHYRSCLVQGQGAQILGEGTGSPAVSRGPELPGLAAPLTPCPCMPGQWLWHPKSTRRGSWLPAQTSSPLLVPGLPRMARCWWLRLATRWPLAEGQQVPVSSTVSRGARAPAALGCHAVGMCQRSVPSRYLLL